MGLTILCILVVVFARTSDGASLNCVSSIDVFSPVLEDQQWTIQCPVPTNLFFTGSYKFWCDVDNLIVAITSTIDSWSLTATASDRNAYYGRIACYAEIPLNPTEKYTYTEYHQIYARLTCSQSDADQVISEGEHITITCQYNEPTAIGAFLVCDVTNFDDFDVTYASFSATIIANRHVTSGSVRCYADAHGVRYYSKSTFSYIIHYGPYDIRIDRKKVLYYVGDAISCTSDAYPTAAHSWQLPNGTRVGPSVTIVEAWRGTARHMTCIASNEVDIRNDNVSFTVSQIDQQWVAYVIVCLLLIVLVIIVIFVYHKIGQYQRF